MGRYSVTKKRKDLEREVAARLGVNIPGSEGVERYNVAPTQEVLAIVQDRDGRRARLLRWGLVPHWSAEPAAGLTMINARAETLTEKPAYRDLVARGSRRCLVLADGFYEWARAEDPRQPRRPLRFSLRGGGSFCFAGLWTRWRRGPEGAVSSCTIVTTGANELVAPLHDRMPVVLTDSASWQAWLDPGLDGEAVAPLLAPLPADRLSVAPANPALNSWEYEGPDCLVARASQESGRGAGS
jgi:putative SOS response-associated peptidase YedK